MEQIGNIIMIFLFFFLSPIFWIFYSGLFFCLVIKKLEYSNMLYSLKYFCIFMMLLAVEALLRSMIYVNSIWDNYRMQFAFFLTLSILSLCFFLFITNKKLNSLVTYNIYIFFVGLLIWGIILFPGSSLIFEASLQILAAWGCAAAALYGVSQLILIVKDTTTLQKQCILKRMIYFCVLLAIWVLFWTQDTRPEHLTERELRSIYAGAVSKHEELHPGVLSLLPSEEILEVTDLVDGLNSKYTRTGAISVVLKRGVFFLQYDIDAWTYCNRGVSSIGHLIFPMIFPKTNMSIKKQIAVGSANLLSPDLDSQRYDGKGTLFFQKILDSRSFRH